MYAIVFNQFMKCMVIFLVCVMTLSKLNASEHNNTFAREASENHEKPTTNPKKAKLQKFLNSKLGQWLIKRLEKKIERRQARIQKRIARGKKINKKNKDRKFNHFFWGLGLILGGLLIMIIISATTTSTVVTRQFDGLFIGLAMVFLGLLIWIVGIIKGITTKSRKQKLDGFDSTD